MVFVIAAQFVLWRQNNRGVEASVLPRVGDIGEWARVASIRKAPLDQSRQFGDDVGGEHVLLIQRSQ